MTEDINTFKSFSSITKTSTVRIADGSHFQIEGKQDVIISKDIQLSYVLCVPKLECNLISISKIIHNLHCVVNFHSNFYKF